MVKVLSDYRGKYDEFEKSMKKAKETFKKYEKEIKQMNQKITALEAQKKNVNKEYGNPNDISDKIKKFE